MEQDAQRAHRQRVAQEKAAAKQSFLQASAEAAESYERLIKFLTDAHRVEFQRYDWAAIAHTPWPDLPARSNMHERDATIALEGYKPSWFARMFGGASRRRRVLTDRVMQGKAADDAAFTEALKEVEQKKSEITHARAVLERDGEALKMALHEHADFTNIAIEGLRFTFHDNRVIAAVNAFELPDLPTKSVTRLQSGKASVKPLSAKKIHELHRDNVCSVALRVAIEGLQALPYDAIEVVVETDLLNKATGHIEPKPVLYGRFTAQAVATMDLAHAEPGPAAEHLGAVLDWSPREGLRVIDVSAFDLAADIFISDNAGSADE